LVSASVRKRSGERITHEQQYKQQERTLIVEPSPPFILIHTEFQFAQTNWLSQIAMPATVEAEDASWGKGGKRERVPDDIGELTPKKLTKQSDEEIQQTVKTPVTGSVAHPKAVRNNLVNGFDVDYMPNGAWITKRVPCPDDQSRIKTVHVCTSFLPSGLSIRCHAMTNAIGISCFGFSRIKVLFKGDEMPSAGPPRMSVKEIDVEDYSIDGTAEMQSIYLNTPWPCKTVEIIVLKRSQQFVTVCEVECYSSNIRSSSQSTPASKKQAGQVAHGSGMILKGIKAGR
jgi:hypothetical protein